MANYTILLIDYEPRSIERFRDPLLAAGYGIEIATDGITGIEAFHRLKPDMVLVEAMIPKKHGFEVCQELKRTPHGRTTPVIITTGVYKGRKYRTQALHIYGCDEYIEKPIAPEQLLELVGKFLKPGPSGSPPKATERGPSQSEPGGGSTPQATGGSIAKVVSTQTTLAPQALANSDSDDEISARLDALLSGPIAAKPDVFSGSHAMLATAVDPVAVGSLELDPIPGDDPFAEIRAELNAELAALPDPDELELDAAVSESLPDFIPSDQLAPPSILETLPDPEMELQLPELDLASPSSALPAPEPELEPELEASIPTAPEPAPIDPVERPGQVVEFDTKRSRKNKKQNKARTNQTETSRAAQPVQVPPRQESSAQAALEPVASVAALTLPRGTVVESELNAPVARRGMPVWVWAVAGIIVVVGIYFMVSRGTPDRSLAAAPVETPANPVDNSASVPPAAPRISEPQAAEPPPTVVPEPKPLVAQAERPPAPKKPVERPTKLPMAAPAAVDPNAAKPTPAVTAPAAVAAPSAPPVAAAPAAAAPAGLDDSVAGVETLPDPVAKAAPEQGKAALIPIDEADTMPVSLVRKPPVYSEQAKQMRLSGTVVVNLLVNEQGTVDQVVLVIGVPGADLNESAIGAAKTWTYRPATKNGVPVKVWKSEQIVFKR